MSTIVRRLDIDVENTTFPIDAANEGTKRRPPAVVPTPIAIVGIISPTREKTPEILQRQNESKSLLSNKGLQMLILLVFQTSIKNLIMQFVMKDHPKFLLSTAVITVQLIKLFLSAAYIRFAQRKSVFTIVAFIKDDWHNTLRLIVPSTAYSVQMTLEFVAFANMDASVFQVLVQMKLPITAFFFRTVLGKKLKMKQVLSLIILTVGVMLCNIEIGVEAKNNGGDIMVGIIATIAIATFSSFASVFTEKVIKSARKMEPYMEKSNHSLAHVQAQMAVVSLIILGFYAIAKDSKIILEKGFFYEFELPAFFSCVNNAIGGLIVAAVLSYSDSVLKGYAGALSIVFTGLSSMFIFGTSLTTLYYIGVINIVAAMLMYNGNELDRLIC